MTHPSQILNITAQHAMQAASLTAPHTAAAKLAQELCLLVGVDPFAYGARAGSLAQGASIPNWQFVIAEQLLGSALRISLRDGPGGGLGIGGLNG